MKNLTDFFSKVFVINCAHRPDRLECVKEELCKNEMADLEKVSFYAGIIGDYVSHPHDWGAGNGAWGCLQSHRRILEDVMHDRDERGQEIHSSILILEDDVVFTNDAKEKLNEFMEIVPSDWGQIYLGGQHQQPAKKSKIEGVMVGVSINRTHAYAVNKSAYQQVYRHISYMSDYIGTSKHVDHQLELAHVRGDWKVYCPPKWIAGQAAGPSNISGAVDAERFWMSNH